MTRTYRFAMAVCSPVVRRWGRLRVAGLEHLPAEGPVLLAGNHDSAWDPVAIGIAARPRRQIQALAKASLWKPGLGAILDGMGQIPIERGRGDAHAMDRAIAELRAGACIGIFPEGTRTAGARAARAQRLRKAGPRGARGAAGLRRGDRGDRPGAPPAPAAGRGHLLPARGW